MGEVIRLLALFEKFSSNMSPSISSIAGKALFICATAAYICWREGISLKPARPNRAKIEIISWSTIDELETYIQKNHLKNT